MSNIIFKQKYFNYKFYLKILQVRGFWNTYYNFKETLTQKFQTRFQSTTFSTTPTTEKYSFKRDWENAKPFEEIPGLNKFLGIFSFLPGGKYYKLDPNKLMLAFKRDLGNISRFDGYFGRNDMVITHNVNDFITVFRNEGTWPIRPGLQALEYHRTEYRKDFFQGMEGIITTYVEKYL